MLPQLDEDPSILLQNPERPLCATLVTVLEQPVLLQLVFYLGFGIEGRPIADISQRVWASQRIVEKSLLDYMRVWHRRGGAKSRSLIDANSKGSHDATGSFCRLVALFDVIGKGQESCARYSRAGRGEQYQPGLRAAGGSGIRSRRSSNRRLRRV